MTELTRRKFLISGLAVGAAGAAGAAASQHRQLSRLVGGSHHRSPPAGPLVLLTLYGGNDGLNTVIPAQDSRYLSGRGPLGYQPNEVLPLADGLSLHPSLKGFKGLWDARQLGIVRGVGYPQPNRSHFRSMDIWQSASPSTPSGDGWLGRWLDRTGADPMRALAIGPTVPLALVGQRSFGGAVPVGGVHLPSGDLSSLTRADATDGPLEAAVAASGADLLRVAATVGPVASQLPARSADPLGAQLDLIASCIRAGLPPKVYAASLGSFDTHANEKATHARLLGALDAAVTGFVRSMAGHPRGQGVVVLMYSEFGRRVAANASGGTDHGTAAPVFVAGPSVKGGFYGEEPSLADLDQGDLKFTTDFRQVYATVLDHVLGIDPADVLGGRFAPVAFL